MEADYAQRIKNRAQIGLDEDKKTFGIKNTASLNVHEECGEVSSGGAVLPVFIVT